MITITQKEYEIEEPIAVKKVIEGKEETLYEFKMQITSKELSEIKDLIFNDEVKDAQKKIQKLKLEKKYDEIEKAEEEIGNKMLEETQKVKEIIFKGHLTKIKEITDKYYFEKLYEEILGFFINTFVKEKIKPYNTTITDLQKISQK